MSIDKVLDWFKKTGFPLEMQAAAAFRNAGFEVRQSYAYPDPQSEKGREIDILAQDPDWIGIVEVSFIVECKSSPNPWVVLTSDDALANYNRIFAFAITSEAARAALAKRLPGEGPLWEHILRPSRVGYGFRQAFKEEDPAYAAAIATAKACRGVVRDRSTSRFPVLTFCFPVIVVDAPLYECTLADDGEVSLKEVAESDFLFSAYIPDETGCCIKVVTKSNLPAYAAWAKNLASLIRREFKTEEEGGEHEEAQADEVSARGALSCRSGCRSLGQR